MSSFQEDLSVDSTEEPILDNVRDCLDSLTRQGRALQQQLASLETADALANQSQTVSETVALLRTSTNAMINSCTEYLETVEIQARKYEKALRREREKRQRLETILEQLAQQHSKLEQAAHLIVSATDTRIITSESNMEERETRPLSKPAEIVSSSSDEDGLPAIHRFESQFSFVRSREGRIRRRIIPEKPNYPIDLWSIMKKCIGKDLWKMSMPVNFNEPISMLQRLTEDYEYAELLDKAAQCSDPYEQLAYVAAFSISSYSTTANRTGKPFNPLLGETFEFDRMSDLGWRVIAEQVSHHPPITAIHCEGKAWTAWQDITVTSKFRGKDLQLVPWGIVYVNFASGHRYSWKKVTTTIHNIIFGKLWIDHHGETQIVGQNLAKGLKCCVKYFPYSYFSREPQRKVSGVITNEDNESKWLLRGNWDDKIEIARVRPRENPSVGNVPEVDDYVTVWNRRPPLHESDKYYNFTLLACQLNEMEEGVAPTDSRLRPDQRLMEEGLWDESNVEKTRLEEKQRGRQKSIAAETLLAAAEGRPSMFVPYEAVWFERQEVDDEEGSYEYVYKGAYWEHKKNQDWSICPEIYSNFE